MYRRVIVYGVNTVTANFPKVVVLLNVGAMIDTSWFANNDAISAAVLLWQGGMESGNAAPEDIIASVRNGIYVDEFSNGQVKIGEGDFTFFVKSGYLIEGGRLTAPVKDINIIGNGPQALADIVAVGNDLKIDNGTWTCGKEQSVAVSCGMPTVLISNLTVGGE